MLPRSVHAAEFFLPPIPRAYITKLQSALRISVSECRLYKVEKAVNTREDNTRAQERMQIGFCCAYERGGARLRVNFSHCNAPRIPTVNCEWDTILEGDVSCTEELVASVQTICSSIGKALHTHFLCQRDSRAMRTQKVDGRKSNPKLGTEEL